MHNDKRGKVGPKRSARMLETVERARQILKESPAKSVRRIAQEVGVSKSSLSEGRTASLPIQNTDASNNNTIFQTM